MKQITREVTTTDVKVALIKVDEGKLVHDEVPTITLAGNPSDKQLNNLLVDRFESQQFVILSKESKTEKYQMSVLTFIENATKLEQE